MSNHSHRLKNVSGFALTAMLFTPFITSAYQAAPVVSTKTPTYVTEKGARINGAANPNEIADTYVWFEWGIAGKNQFYQTPHRSFSGSSQLYDTYEDIYGLAPNVQYYYRIVAESSRGKDIGQTIYFTTKPLTVTIDPIVIVSTNDATAITESGAMLHGYIAPHESSGVEYWFQWGTTNKLENETPHSSWGKDSGDTEKTLSGLTSGSVYFYRMVAQNGLGLVYGTTRVFTTSGLPPPPAETQKSQNVSGASAGDGVTRTVTASGNTTTGTGASSLPGYNVFGAFFGNKGTTNTARPATTNTGNTNTNSNSNTNTSASAAVNNNVAALADSNPVGSFWDTLTGKKVVEVHVEKVGPAKVPEHTPIEYRITYSYRITSHASNAKLKIILPASVIYIGDNTNNELLLEESAGGERTYDLIVGRLESGSTRTISILGITTGDAKGVFPDARARLEYTDSIGASNVVASVSGASESTASSETSSGSGYSILPSSLLGWLLYVLTITGLIFGIRKLKAFYQKRKEAIALEDEASRRGSGSSSFPGGQVAV